MSYIATEGTGVNASPKEMTREEMMMVILRLEGELAATRKELDRYKNEIHRLRGRISHYETPSYWSELDGEK